MILLELAIRKMATRQGSLGLPRDSAARKTFSSKHMWNAATTMRKGGDGISLLRLVIGFSGLPRHHSERAIILSRGNLVLSFTTPDSIAHPQCFLSASAGERLVVA